MSDRGVKTLVILTAILLLMAGCFLIFLFDKQGLTKKNNNNYINYNIDNYIEILPVIFNDYSDVYSSISVSKVNIKNLDNELIKKFNTRQSEIIDYINGYYNEIKSYDMYHPINNVTSVIKKQINGTVLSILYRVDFNLDSNIFTDTSKSYFITYNYDLGTNKILSNDDMLSKYNYSKMYIAEKLFNDDIIIQNGQIVIDKETNMSLTKNDIERKKEYYITKVENEFDNIISMYIEKDSLVLIYDKKEIKDMFFDNEFQTEIESRYLK